MIAGPRAGAPARYGSWVSTSVSVEKSCMARYRAIRVRPILSFLSVRGDADAASHPTVGARPGALVAIYLDRSPAMVAALLGVLWAGCAYVPLDPEHPPERTAFVLADAGVAAVITERRPAPALEGRAQPVKLTPDYHGGRGVAAGRHRCPMG